MTTPLDVYILDVGHGDCVFLNFPSGNLTIIDMNNSKSLPRSDEVALATRLGMTIEAFCRKGIFGTQSREQLYLSRLDDPSAFHEKHFHGRTIHRYIQTHPDMDHMSGIWRMFWGGISVRNFWDTSNEKVQKRDEFEGGRYDENDWLTYLQMRKGKSSPHNSVKVLHLYQNEVGPWTTDGITILSPTERIAARCNDRKEWNDISYVLRIDFGGRRIVLPGDAEEPAWKEIMATFGADDLRCNVLKASHHGRKSGYYRPAVAAMDPEFVICSVGKEPSTDASGLYELQGAEVFSTRDVGTIRIRIWDHGKLTITNSRGSTIGALPSLQTWAQRYW